ERNSGTAKRLAGIITAGLVGIEYGQRVRHTVLVREMVIGDDEVEAKSLRGFGGGECANAGIDADDEAYAFGGSLLDHFVAHAIAFEKAMGNVEVASSSAEFDRGLQNDDGHSTVDVIVAVDKNPLAVLNGGAQSL